MATYSTVYCTLQSTDPGLVATTTAARTYDQLAGVQQVCSTILCIWTYRMLIYVAAMYMLYTLGLPPVSGNDYGNHFSLPENSRNKT